LHWVLDVVFREDASRVRAGHAAQVMAAFRNAAIGLIHALGSTRVAATCRLSMAQPLAAFLALGTQPDLEETLVHPPGESLAPQPRRRLGAHSRSLIW
jgi:hypothetical protein